MSKVEDMIKKNKSFHDFVKGEKGCMEFNPYGVQISIFKEETGCGYYYKLPYNESCSYENVVTFMKKAIPIISKMIEEERNRKLYSDGCISGAKLK